MQHINFVLFCLVALPLILTPGPDIIYIVTRGIAQGRSTAVLSMFGVCAGYVGHTLLAVCGLSALVHTSEVLFNLVRYAGAAYLIYLGVRALISKQHFDFARTSAPAVPKRLFVTGMLTSLLNPKAILFFFSFLPQFIVPGAGQVPLQLLGLGLLFTFFCMLVYGAIAVLSGSLGNRLSSVPMFANTLRWVTGSILIGLGLRLMVPEQR